jgi:REP element-mobilizing transposase RayT
MPPPPIPPLAYHITWGTYGTRLHGDDRGIVLRDQNQFGEPIIGADSDLDRAESANLRFPPRFLTPEQRRFIESVYPEICTRGNWEPIVIAAAPDHVHTVLRGAADGQDIRKWLKRWMTQALSSRWTLHPGELWWAECGSVKWIWKPDYFDRVVNYVTRQKTTK